MIKRRKFIQSASMIAIGASAFGYQFSHAQSQSLSSNLKNKNGMLTHNVFFYLNENVNADQKKAFEKGMKKFLSSVKEINEWEIGTPAATEEREVVDHSFDYALLVKFSSLENHEIYQKHPAHAIFIEDFAELWKEVKVYDVEIL